MTKTNNDSEIKKPKTSWLAVLSFILSIPGFCTNGLLSILSLFLGIIAFIRIKKSSGRLRGKDFAIIGIVISTVVLLFLLWNSLPFVKTRKNLKAAQVTLLEGRLANLPSSATGLKAGGWGALFTGESYIKFNAEPQDINKFIAESPSIKNLTPEILTPEHMYLPRPGGNEFEEDFDNYIKHKYYNESSYPPWYKPTIKIKGRLYKIPGDPNNKGHNWGTVIIDDQTNTVYISIIWS